MGRCNVLILYKFSAPHRMMTGRCRGGTGAVVSGERIKY